MRLQSQFIEISGDDKDLLGHDKTGTQDRSKDWLRMVAPKIMQFSRESNVLEGKEVEFRCRGGGVRRRAARMEREVG